VKKKKKPVGLNFPSASADAAAERNRLLIASAETVLEQDAEGRTWTVRKLSAQPRPSAA
jgi:hypothetical protein